MPAIMADNDVDGQVTILLDILHGIDWLEIWTALDFSLESFESLGLPRDTNDATIWKVCQEKHIVLITGNRNRHELDSLDATIIKFNMPDSLPVITIANPTRVASSKGYARKVAERLIETLFDLEKYRGTGRLFIP